MSSASKSYDLDPIPTNILKLVIDIFLPFVITIINKSLAESSVPSSFKHSSPSTTEEVRTWHRTIAQFWTFPSFQNFWKKWSVHALSIILYQTICKILTNLHTVYIILSAAFDVIDHSILVKRLNLSYGICGEAFRWIESYLNNRYQRAAVHPCQLIFNWIMEYLEPKLCCMFSKPICEICWRHRLSYHTYADDTQVYMVIKSWATLAARLEACLSDISDWKKTYMLKINQD